jgi:hypothetical protein
MSSPKKKIPEFKSEKGEKQFWAKHDSTEFIDWSAGERQKLPNLKPSLRTAPYRFASPPQ